MSAQLPNAGVPGPIPDDFDFDAHLAVPDGLTMPEIPLPTRVARNVEIEAYNNDSIFRTVNAKETPSPRPAGLDIGPPLRRLYSFSDEEFQEMVDSEALCASLAPLPIALLRFIEGERALAKKSAEQDRLAGKDKDKEGETKMRTKLLGSMQLLDPVKRVPAQRDRITIPTTYLLCIKNKLCPPLNFFTNEHIDAVNYTPQDVHFKLLRPWADEDTTEKVQLLDMPKMISLWGSDDVSNCLTPFRFVEASGNLLAALELLCNPSPPVSVTIGSATPSSTVLAPLPTFASEYRKHRDFFTQLDNFEVTYPDWYPFELKARRDILKGVLFDWDAYAAEVLLRVRLGELERERRNPSTFPKRASEADSSYPYKFPRHSRTDAPPAAAHSRQPFRPGAPRVPQCLICARGHSFRDHPSAIVAFEDGKPLFSRLRDNALWTAKSHKGSTQKRICTLYNLNRFCDNRHGPDALHLCSFCGAQHAAFERSPSCDRTFDGFIQA